MLPHLEWQFCTICCVIFVLMQLRPSMPRTTWFGILNCMGLAAVLGWKGLVLIGVFSTFLWALLKVARWAAVAHCREWPYLAVAVWVGVLFIAQKWLYELDFSSEHPGRRAIVLLQLIAFSYVALRAWDATEAVRQGQQLLSPIALSGYLAPFFMMPAGPINVYNHHLDTDTTTPRQITWPWFIEGVELIARGLFVKLCLAEALRLSVVGVRGEWPTDSFIGSALTFAFIYLDFWGYSLVALGIGALLGIATPVNFDRPFTSTSLTEFWSRWHMSLGEFVRRLIYYPLQLWFMRRTNGARPYLVNAASLAAAFIFVGLWHRLTLLFIAWGLLFGIVLALEKYIRDRIGPALFDRAWVNYATAVIGPVYVATVVIGLLHLTAMAQMVGAR